MHFFKLNFKCIFFELYFWFIYGKQLFLCINTIIINTDKPGYCPAPYRPRNCRPACSSDHDCSGKLKCCSDKWCENKQCKRPVNGMCLRLLLYLNMITLTTANLDISGHWWQCSNALIFLKTAKCDDNWGYLELPRSLYRCLSNNQKLLTWYKLFDVVYIAKILNHNMLNKIFFTQLIRSCVLHRLKPLRLNNHQHLVLKVHFLGA